MSPPSLHQQSFLITIGYPIRLATPEERSAALARSASMPIWPAAGSVILQDGVAIVKFAEP